jgi:FAD/FMN-containing dehydrogenase
VAENAGGLRGLKYGVTRDYVMGLQFFDVNSELIKTGARTVKCATGYNLAGLLVGSEGTLGVFDRITLLTDKRDKAEWERVEKAIAAIFDRALAPGGTLSGEHGTGIAKARFLENEAGLATILYFRRIKKALDPHNILNPGKVIGAAA